jgi:predicted DNA-binding transcriptional regulator YafY
MKGGMSRGPRFVARPLTDEEAQALVARGVPPEARQHQARIVVHAPAAQLLDRWGPTLGTVTPIDATSCTIHAGADSLEQLAAWLAFLGADFRVTEPPELVDAVRALAGRFAAATA